MCCCSSESKWNLFYAKARNVPKTEMQIWGPVPRTKPNVRRSHICGTLLNCFCGFQSFAVCACACVPQSVCPSRRWRAKSFTYAVMHACCAAGPASWSCRTIYACAKYGGTAHFYLYRLLAPFVVCVDGLFRLVVSNIECYRVTLLRLWNLLQLATSMKWRPMVIYRWSRRQRLPFQTIKIRLDSYHRYHRRCVPPKCFSRWAYFQVHKEPISSGLYAHFDCLLLFAWVYFVSCFLFLYILSITFIRLHIYIFKKKK